MLARRRWRWAREHMCGIMGVRQPEITLGGCEAQLDKVDVKNVTIVAG